MEVPAGIREGKCHGVGEAIQLAFYFRKVIHLRVIRGSAPATRRSFLHLLSSFFDPPAARGQRGGAEED